MSPIISPSIEYLKTALSVNTALGCSLGCGYCIVGEILRKSPKKISTPKKVVEDLIQNRLFVRDRTPLVINNKTDPFLGFVKEDTFEILRLLQKRDLKNPRIIISKLPLTKRDLGDLEALNEPVFFVTSYSHLRFPIERSNSENQLVSLRTLQKRDNVKSLHYWRPLIKGLNDEYSSIERVLESVASSCDGSILSGLRLTSKIAKRMIQYGADLSGWDGDLNHKYLPIEIQQKVIKKRDELFPDYPLFRHTSCALSTMIGESDYGFNYLKGKSHCMEDCYNSCSLGHPPLESEVKKYFNQAGINGRYSINKESIQVKGELTQEERSFLSNALRFPIKSSKLKKNLSERLLTEENGNK